MQLILHWDFFMHMSVQKRNDMMM